MKKQAGCNPKSSDKFWKLLSQALAIDPGICFRITLLTCMVLIKISKLCNSELLSIHDGKICLLIKLFPGTVFLICHLVCVTAFCFMISIFLQLSKTDDLLSDAHVVSDSKEVSNEEKAEKKKKLEETHDGDIR